MPPHYFGSYRPRRAETEAAPHGASKGPGPGIQSRTREDSVSMRRPVSNFFSTCIGIAIAFGALAAASPTAAWAAENGWVR